MQDRQDYGNLDPDLSEDEYQEAADVFDDPDIIIDHDLAIEEQFDTQEGDGHTYNPHTALDQGLTYTPPDDPATMPGGDENVVVAAGFGQSMEDAGADEDTDDDDSDGFYTDEEVAEMVRTAIRFNSETQNLDSIRVRVRNGVVQLRGTVPDDMDLSNVDDIVSEIKGVVEVDNRLDTEY